MATKCQRTKRGISLSSEKEKNYDSNIRDKMDPD